MYATARLLDDGGPAWLGVGAAALAGLALTRVDYGWVNTVLLVGLLAWWAVARSRTPRRLAAMLGLSLVLCVPWLAYTASETGRVLVWGNSGSLSLYWMSSPESGDLGDWQQANDVFTNPNLAAHEPRLRAAARPRAPGAERRAREARGRNIVSNPLKYAENIAANVSRMFFDAPYSYTEQRLSAVFFALPNALLLSVALLAAVGAYRMRESLPAAAVPFAAFALVSFGLHALVAAYPRMLMPIVPVVVWFAATVGENVRLARPTVQGSSDAADEGGDRGGAEMTTDAGAGSCDVSDERERTSFSGAGSPGRPPPTLQELGETGWQTFEREDRVGGHARSIVVDGYTFDSAGPHPVRRGSGDRSADPRPARDELRRAVARGVHLPPGARSLHALPVPGPSARLTGRDRGRSPRGLVRAVEGQARGEPGRETTRSGCVARSGTASPST